MNAKRKFRILVDGRGCGEAGAPAIERDLTATEGVPGAYLDPATETVYVHGDSAETNPTWLARVIGRAGYRPGQPVES